MADNGHYGIRLHNPLWGEILRAAATHTCWGGEVNLPNGDLLITHSKLCDKKIRPRELYLKRMDPRDPTCFQKTSIYCAAAFHASELDGDLTPYLYVSEEMIAEARDRLHSIMQALGSDPNGEEAASKAVALEGVEGSTPSATAY